MRAYLGLGSNLGDRRQFLLDAVRALDERIDVSAVYETDPVGGPEDQGAFLNLVVAIETTRSPRELLELCQSLETAAGRVRVEHWGPRTLDADVLLVDDLAVNEPDLVVPHPLWRERAFVVEPLRDVAEASLLASLPALDTSGVRRVGSLWGDWDTSLRPTDAAEWFASWDGPWAIAGGWAIELFAGRPVRPHQDLDVVIARADVGQLHDQLEGWEIFIASSGVLTPWPAAAPLDDAVHQVWCRRVGEELWTHEVQFEDIRDGVLHYRRDSSIALPLEDAILRTADGIPYLAPHLQLLYKSKSMRARDELDFAAALPLLSPEQRAWLDAATTPRA